MQEGKAVILLIAITAILITGSVSSDLFGQKADGYYFLTDAFWKMSLSAILLYFFRYENKRSLAIFFSCLMWLCVGNMGDEMFSEDPSKVSMWEYFWDIIGVVSAFFEYYKFYPIKLLYQWTQSK